VTPKRRRELITLIQMLIPVALALTLTTSPATVLYSVSAETEAVTVTIKRETAWQVHDARIVEDGNARPPFSGFIRPQPGVEVSMQRVGAGALRIRLEQPRTEETRTDFVLAELRDESDEPRERIGGQVATIIVEASERNGGALTMSVVGDLRVGRSVDSGSYGANPMLRSGDVAMSVFTLGGFGSDRYFTDRRHLSAGDEFRVEKPQDGQGFIRIDDRQAMTVVYWAAGERAWVKAFDKQYLYLLETSTFDRIRSDPALQLFWSIAGAFVLRFIVTMGRGRALAGAGLVLMPLAWSASPAAASTFVIHVAAGAQHGVGMPRWWDGHCYVITPEHVIHDAHGDIGLVGRHRRQARAVVHWRNEGLDLAVLKVTEGGDAACPERSWMPTGALDDLLSRATKGTLHGLGQDGGDRRSPVFLSKVQGTQLEVAPTLAGAEIVQGQSGSLLEVDGRRTGMLLQVTDEGRGKVMRADYMERILDPVFPSKRWPIPGRIVCLRHDKTTAPLVEPLADAIRAAGGLPRTDCRGRPNESDTLTLTGTETTDVFDGSWIVAVRATVVVEGDGREKGRRHLRVTGSSTLDARRAHDALAADLREQIEKADDLQSLLGISPNR
jgi:hypothetical protein